jgi:hypothetical protein
MSDRKYRQRGYQDDAREPKSAPAPGPKPEEPRAPRGQSHLAPKTYNMPGFHEVVRCARCGNPMTPPVSGDARCKRCGADLHACINCISFDPGTRWECTENRNIPARIVEKDARNECTLFTPKTAVERETHSQAPASARKAFDDLFK